MKINNKKIIGVIATILLVVIIISASFAYFGSFNVNLNSNVAVNINASSPGNATLVSKSAILNLQVPAVNMSQTNAGTLASEANATLTVELTGAANLATTCTYDVLYEYDASSNVYGTSPTTKNGDKEITIQVESPNGTNNFSTEKNFDTPTISSYNKSGKIYTLVSNVSIVSTGTKTSQDIKITAKYYNLDKSQDNLAGKAFTGKIYAVKNNCETMEPGYMTILNNNGGKEVIEAKGNPTFTSVATTNEGMYAMEDDLGISYYFRGAVDNNWVKFGKDSSNNDIYWRIIRINGDGSIRMIYTGTNAPTEDTKVVMTGEGTQIGTSAFNSTYNSSEYVGYMYTIGEQHGTSKDSTIKTALDNWYETTTLKTDESTKSLVADEIYCNDRSASTSQNGPFGEISSWDSIGTIYYYGAHGRIYNKNNPSPSLKCTTLSDKFTVDSVNGNGTLAYPVGLITADELIIGGTKWSGSNSNYYLYTNITYWSETPRSWSTDSAAVSRVFLINDSGALINSIAVRENGIRPVISISSKAKLSGNGTWNNVYTVS